MAAPGEPRRYGCSSPVQSCYCFRGLAFANGTAGARGAWNLVSSSETLWFAVGTGILGSLMPYSLELIALRGLAPNAFSILIALEPVFAAFFGWLLLAQHISTLKLLAITVVIAASVLQTISTDKERSAVNLDEAGSVGGAD